MTAVFADTLFYVALLNRRDEHHAAAVNWASRERPMVVTTEFVLLEVANFFKDPPGRGRFTAFVNSLEDDPDTTIIPCDTYWFRRGLDRFASRLDKSWSLTDCISFVVMEQYALTEALTADQDFKQAGFTILL